MIRLSDNQVRAFAIALVALAVLYITWKVTQSPTQALQFTFNGLSVGAVYALLAIGFTIVYSTVWFFDLYYGAASALGAYGVFYLRSHDALGGRYEVNHPIINAVFGAVTAGAVAWAFHQGVSSRLRTRISPTILVAIEVLVAAGAGIYMGFVLTFPAEMNVWLSPAVGLAVAVGITWILQQVVRRVLAGNHRRLTANMSLIVGGALGAYCGFLIYGAPEANLYLSWATSCLLAGMVGLVLYSGLYVYMRERARSPLIMLVATLGLLLAITAFITIVFSSSGRPLPDAFGSTPWRIAGANIKPFNVFTIGVAVVGFIGVLALIQRTSFGKAMRAIGDDEEVSKVVGINTTVIIAVVFFIGAAFAGLAGVLSGHDTAIQPRMGLLLLLKGWVASVVGGIGNLYGAIIGGFVLGIVEQFGIWDLAGEWKDAISFILLILFLSFWPNGLLPRR